MTATERAKLADAFLERIREIESSASFPSAESRAAVANLWAELHSLGSNGEEANNA
jgi:hypothetical protein